MIRKARQSDILALVELSIEAVSRDPDDRLVPSRARILEAVKECVCSAANFAWVSEIDGEIVGALGAIVQPLMFHERNQAVVVMWYVRKPGDGIRLRNEFMRWLDSRPMIKQVIYTEERQSDPRIALSLKQVGFQDCLPTHVLTR